MAITQAVCTSYKEDLLAGVHQPGDDYKIALFTSAATLDATTTAYSTTNEASGTGYTAGGKSLTGYAASSGSGVAFLDWDDVVWTSSTITAAGALIYNATQTNKAVAVLSFGGDVTSTSADFTVTMPTADSTNAIVRIA